MKLQAVQVETEYLGQELVLCTGDCHTQSTQITMLANFNGCGHTRASWLEMWRVVADRLG